MTAAPLTDEEIAYVIDRFLASYWRGGGSSSAHIEAVFSRFAAAMSLSDRSTVRASVAACQSRSPRSSRTSALKRVYDSPSRSFFLYTVTRDPTSPANPRRAGISSRLRPDVGLFCGSLVLVEIHRCLLAPCCMSPNVPATSRRGHDLTARDPMGGSRGNTRMTCGRIAGPSRPEIPGNWKAGPLLANAAGVRAATAHVSGNPRGIYCAAFGSDWEDGVD
jgi:hypothetical protein